ncbi:Maf family protein [Amycolatopsis keratiniphila]|uniref:Nucleoside triphosphate pyrophosphatase n=2 Tax=Amycolatopsis keratiniphila TaxID=129921 RepID=R4STN9_9PSEU|nr:nucleoside triphosphate pyrophosphatase [Amycolatopsis keratiniphila]AGM03521.1 septum formation protein [Amycolatopsis keratiniphila]OLZ57018.1 septum formation inhibitor Maf [Amycolatopsis keratiniphila subsp. nogabecina]ONF65636.1 septum formation inhibitor Maf [Amycolatopsis keratiniphila subsp. keratiniphila]SDU49317.1 septum formation protein [Amycolatopsis keratiniphila]
MRFVLASQSPARLGVLRSAGFDPSVVVSGVDEDAVAASLTDPAPEELVRALAAAKAEAVFEALGGHSDLVIVGCDSMLSINGEMVGKPITPEAARERWASMAGKTGELLTGHAIIRVENGERTKEASGTEGTTVRFGTPSQEEIEAYIASGEPLQVAGGFTLDGLGGWFIEGIDGDFSSVIGISLPLTRRLLTEVGVSVIDLWTRPAS